MLAGARRRLRLLYLGVLAATVALVVVRWPAFVRLGFERLSSANVGFHTRGHALERLGNQIGDLGGSRFVEMGSIDE